MDLGIAGKVALVFGGSKYFEDLQLGNKLKRKFPDAIVIGCSSAGEIVNDPAVYDDTLVVTALADDAIALQSSIGYITESSTFRLFDPAS